MGDELRCILGRFFLGWSRMGKEDVGVDVIADGLACEANGEKRAAGGAKE